jgi:hypothetical protein
MWLSYVQVETNAIAFNFVGEQFITAVCEDNAW